MLGGIYPGQSYPAGIGQNVITVIIRTEYGLDVSITLPNIENDTLPGINSRHNFIVPVHSRTSVITSPNIRRVHIGINKENSEIIFP